MKAIREGKENTASGRRGISRIRHRKPFGRQKYPGNVEGNVFLHEEKVFLHEGKLFLHGEKLFPHEENVFLDVPKVFSTGER
jgi:hypothetical protein